MRALTKKWQYDIKILLRFNVFRVIYGCIYLSIIYGILASCASESNENYEDKLAHHENELSKEESNLKILQQSMGMSNEFEEERVRYENEIDSNEAQIKKLERQLASGRGNPQAIKDEIRRLRNRNQELEGQLATLRKENEEQRRTIASKDEEIKVLTGGGINPTQNNPTSQPPPPPSPSYFAVNGAINLMATIKRTKIGIITNKSDTKTESIGYNTKLPLERLTEIVATVTIQNANTKQAINEANLKIELHNGGQVLDSQPVNVLETMANKTIVSAQFKKAANWPTGNYTVKIVDASGDELAGNSQSISFVVK
jgi:DNA repair exonuclease SbcCD ATPase subunit